MIDSFFIHFIMSSLAVSVLLLLILLVKKRLKNHLSARWQYNMDLLILILMVIPFIPDGFLSFSGTGSWLNGLIPGGNTALNAGTAGSEMSPIRYGIDWLQDFSVSVDRSTPQYIPEIIAGLWLAGIAVFAVFTLYCNWKLRLVKESMKPMEDRKLNEMFKQCKSELGIKKNILFGTSILIKSPISVGLIKTRIILPAEIMETLSMEDIRYILLHELMHCKKRDLPVNNIMCLFQILYWFHPLVFPAFREIRQDREIACDASVLKLLPEEHYIDYGKTLLKFVNRQSPSKTLSFATDMGGSKRQIKRRIEGIASFKMESKRLQIKSICVFSLTLLFILFQIPVITVLAVNNDGKFHFQAENVIYEDLASYFNGSTGSFVLYDMEADQYSIYNKEKSVTRVSPASTYKIYSALTALETGVIDTGNSVQNWDGTSFPFEAWNRDQDLMSAMQNSVSWYFQDIDAQVGMQKLRLLYDQLSYGNHDLSGGIENYWMESSLKISPVEQVELLKDLYQNETIFKPEHVDAVKSILRLSEQDGTVLSGKTGTGTINNKTVNGWFVGYVEQGEHTYIFAANIQGKDNAGGSTAVEITLSILKDKRIY